MTGLMGLFGPPKGVQAQDSPFAPLQKQYQDWGRETAELKNKPLEVPFDNSGDWSKFHEHLMQKMPFGTEFPSAVQPFAPNTGGNGRQQIHMDFPYTKEGIEKEAKWNEWMRQQFPDAGGFSEIRGGVYRGIIILNRKTGM